MNTVLNLLHTNGGSSLLGALDEKYYKVFPVIYNEKELEKIFKRVIPDIIALEIEDLSIDLVQVLQKINDIKKESVNTFVIGPSGNTQLIVNSIRSGAYDYIPLPFRRDELSLKFELALKSGWKNRKDIYTDLLEDGEIKRFFGVSKNIQKVMNQVKKISDTDMSVMVQGASGTGKEVIANLIHKLSDRSKENFIAIDCGAIPETLLESELFGYERGAFTGAVTEKPGMIELSNKGTLFLDEIGNLSINNQMKLLRVLEERKVKRLGGHDKRSVDVRIITATNTDLSDAVSKNRFRLDLYHRLNEYTIHLPSLKERKEDIPWLCQFFLKIAEKKAKKKIKEIAPETIQKLIDHEWPGNIRELKNIIHSSVMIADDILLPEHLLLKKENPENSEKKIILNLPDASTPLKEAVRQAVKEIEVKFILDVLQECNGNKSLAAKKLQMERCALYQKIKKYDLPC